MYDLAILSNAIALGWAIFGLVLLVLFSRILDRRAGVTFQSSLALIRQNPLAVAVYYGLRFLACALVVAAALS